jgi:hypothetical protein
MSNHKLISGLILAAGLFCAHSALADFDGSFSGSFAPVNWSTATSGNPTYQSTASVDTSQAPVSITIIGASGSSSPVMPLSVIDYSIPLPGTGPESVLFAYTFDVPNGSTSDAAQVFDNGLVVGNLSPGSSQFSLTGTYFGGDTLDLRVYSDNGAQPDTLNVFSPVPEPSTLALGGFAGLMFVRHLRRKFARR